MNKFSSIIRLCTIIGVLSGGFVYEAVKADVSPLTQEQTSYLDYIENKIQAYVVFSTQWAQNFLSSENNESYITHINRYRDAFVAFERDILHSLRTEKKSAGVAEYGQAISLLHDITTKVYEPAKHVHTILEKHRKNTNPTLLGMDLASTEKYASQDFISGLQTQLKRLQTIFSKIYQSLVKKIDIIIDSLEQRKTKKLNAFESWKALKHRVSCK
jgi:hypothetical protein